MEWSLAGTEFFKWNELPGSGTDFMKGTSWDMHIPLGIHTAIPLSARSANTLSNSGVVFR